MIITLGKYLVLFILFCLSVVVFPMILVVCFIALGMFSVIDNLVEKDKI